MPTKEVFEFTVYEDQWSRGGKSDNPALFIEDDSEEDHKMCCLGFCANQAGVSKRRMKNVAMISGLSGLIPVKLRILYVYPDKDLESEIATINDNNKITDSARKKELKPLFKKAGMKINFAKTKPPKVK